MGTHTTNSKPRARLDAASIKAAARGREVEILTSVAGIPAEYLDGRHHPCPRCGGTDRFRLVDADAGAVYCNQCFSRRNGDFLAAVAWSLGVSFAEALRLVAEHLSMDVDAAPAKGRKTADIIEAVCRAKRMPIDAFRRYGVRAARRGKMAVARVAVYSHAGEVHSYFDLSPSGKGLFRRGQGSSGLFLPGRLPQPGERWQMVEGVKDAAALTGLGYLAAGLPTREMPALFARLFRAVDVVIVPDRDAPGEDGARKTAARLAGHASSIGIATLPGELREREGDDCRDVIAKYGADVMRQVIADARPWKATDDAPPTKRDQPQRAASHLDTVRNGLRERGGPPFEALRAIIQTGSRDAEFVLVIDAPDGETRVNIGKTRHVWHPEHIRDALAEATHHVMRPYTRAKWRRYGEAIIRAATVVETTTDVDEAWSWIETFARVLRRKEALRRQTPDNWWKVAACARPDSGDDMASFFTPDGEAFVVLAELQRVLADQRIGIVSQRQLSTLLAQMGFRRLDQMQVVLTAAMIDEIRSEHPRGYIAPEKTRLRQRFWRGPAEPPEGVTRDSLYIELLRD